MGSLGFCRSYAVNLGVLARGENCTNVHFVRFIASVQKVGLDVHDISLASGWAGVLGYEVSHVNSYCSGTGNGHHESVQSLGLFVRAVASASGDGTRQWSRFFSGAQQSWCSVDPWRQLQICAGVLFGCWGTMVNRAHGTESNSVAFCVSSAVIEVCADLMSLSVRMCQKKRVHVRGS